MVPAAQSWQLGASQAVQMRPLGWDGRPTNPGECRARPSAHMVGTVTETTGREGHSRCEQGSTALLLGALSGGLTYLMSGGKCDSWAGVPSTSDQLATHTVVHISCAVGRGMGTITDGCGELWSRARALDGRGT